MASTPSNPSTPTPPSTPLLSITETPNELTDGIDLASPIGIVRILRQVDAQMFIGWRDFPGIYDLDILRKMSLLVDWLTEVLEHEGPRKIIISGAGTSGRLAYFAARTYNGILRRAGLEPVFDYLMAGGDAALIAAQEGAEDSPQAGSRELARCLEGMERAVYIGITCGVSAPYVAGQIDWIRHNTDFYGVMMGFNPPERARRAVVEGWDKTVGDIVDDILAHPDQLMLLNPVVGPEGITGSTRMKGGSMTKVLLDLLFSHGLETSGILPHDGIDDLPEDFLDEGEDEEGESWRGGLADGEQEEAPWDDPDAPDGLPYASVTDALRDGEDEDAEMFSRPAIERFEDQVRSVYSERGDLARLIEAGGNALRNGGHIYYLGTGSLGILALVDASECPPTFGDKFEDVRGFLEGGWDTILSPGAAPPCDLPHYRLSLVDYEKDILSKLKPVDLVVGVGLNGFTSSVERLMLKSLQSGAQTAAVLVRCPGLAPAERVPPTDPFLDPQPMRNFSDEESERRIPLGHGWLRSVPEWTTLCVSPLSTGHFFGPHRLAEAELAAKLCFNALTTGAHILAGKVYRNRMIDLRISNNKLYYRTLGIIQALTGSDEATARLAMHRSVFGKDKLTDEEIKAPPSVCIPLATWKDKIVPRAILMASGRFTFETAMKELRQEPIVRRLIDRLKS